MLIETILRIYTIQQWYGLSDLTMQDPLFEIKSMKRFTEIDVPTEDVPDETTVVHFRHLLEKHKTTKKLFVWTRKIILTEGYW